MLARLKFPMYRKGEFWSAGVHEFPDGTSLPSSAEVLDALPPEEPKEESTPDTLSEMQEKTGGKKRVKV